jgi:hypothetical protein
MPQVNPQVNPDGTVQVPGSPPLQSAFAPQPTQAPPPPMQAAPGAPATGTPGAAGAIQDLIRTLVAAFAPKQITGRKVAINDAVDKASP